MKTLVALSFGRRAPSPERERVVDRARRLVSHRAGTAPEVWSFDEETGGGAPAAVIVVAGRDAADEYSPEHGRAAVLLARECYTVEGRRLDGATFLARLAADGDDALRAAAPPFAACFRRGPGAPLEVTTDVCGLRHVYTVAGPGWVAASSSSLLLGALAAAPVDEGAFGNFALTGNFMARRTPFAGVEKVEHGEYAQLVDGSLRRVVFFTRDAASPHADTTALVADGARTVRGLVRAAIDSHDEAPTLELSGGIDSRALLAAFLPDERKGLHALTLGTPASPDWIVAEELARANGLDHRTVNLEGLDDMDPAEADALVRRAARRYECSAGAVANGVLSWVESQVGQGPRFNGINGEYARGRFYAAQRARANFTGAQVEQLARWRVFANDAVDPALFRAGFIDDTRAETIRMLQEEFGGYGTDWLRATDDHFLFGRMQRWTGIEFSTSCMERPILAPFFCSPFLTWSCRLDEVQKRGSRIFSAVIEEMDPVLARVPLVTGFSPSDLARRDARTRARLTAQSARRIARKARQRLRPGTDTPPAGAERLARLVRAHWNRTPGVLEPLSDFAMLDPAAIEAVAAGARGGSAASVGFLTDLLVLAQTTRETEAMLRSAP